MKNLYLDRNYRMSR